MNYGNADAGIYRAIRKRQLKTIALKNLIISIDANLEKRLTSITSKFCDFVIESKVLSITTANIEHYWIVWKFLNEILNIWPWSVPRFTKMISNFIVDIVDILNF